MNRASIRIAAALVLGLCAFAPWRAAHAQDLVAAGRHYSAGREAYDKGQFGRAVEEWKAAFTVTKDPALLVEIGEAQERAGDGAGALATYERYLTMAPTGGDRDAVEKRIAALRAAPPAKEVPPPVPIEPQHAPLAPHAEHSPSVTPPPVAAPEAPPANPDGGEGLAEGPPSKLRVAAWVGIAAAVALVTAGGIMGLAAQSRSDEIGRREAVLGADGQPPKYDSATQTQMDGLHSDGVAFNAAAMTLLSLGAVTAVTAGVLFYLDRRDQRAAKVSLAPALSPGGAGLSARWEF